MVKHDYISFGRRKWEELFEDFELDWTKIYQNSFWGTKTQNYNGFILGLYKIY